MVICFDSSNEGKNALEALMQSGQFRDVSEAISAALVSYQVIHRAVSKGNPVVVGGDVPAPTPATKVQAAASPASPMSKTGVPVLFQMQEIGLEELMLQAVPNSPFTLLPPTRWFFGQYNKFLPVKASCRGLLNLLAKNRNGVPLPEAADSISTAAGHLGDYLLDLDANSDRTREEAFASAFPTRASLGSGSQIRFANQFVGDLRQPKQLENQPRESKFNGFPAALKFMVCADGRTPLLNLTRPGAEFAQLESPVLDCGAQTPNRKFSEAETAFLLAHVRRCVPEEASAYFSVVEGIQKGANTPDTLDQYLCERFSLSVAPIANEDNQITQTFLTTQRTGAISRMVDLGLVTRAKEGLRVTYDVTQAANTFRSQISKREK
jgi:hypothetical protein